jgi:predicted nuclease of predicted toxin-antitoxin system
MRLMLDQGVPRDTAVLLRGRGYERWHVGELGMSKAADEEILKTSLEKGAVVVTLDADFHTMLAVSGASGPSVIRIRLQGLGASEVAGLVEHVIEEFEADLNDGSMITVKAHKTTCHRLPVGGSD